MYEAVGSVSTATGKHQCPGVGAGVGALDGGVGYGVGVPLGAGVGAGVGWTLVERFDIEPFRDFSAK